MEAPDKSVRLSPMLLLASQIGFVSKRAGEHGRKLDLHRSQFLATVSNRPMRA